jgi:hypothetical protein
MKLTIRTDVIRKIEALLTQEGRGPLYLCFGRTTRSGFEVFTSAYEVDCIKRLAPTYPKHRYMTGWRSFKWECDAGDVLHRRLLLASADIKQGNDVTVTSFAAEGFNVLLVHDGVRYGLELEFPEAPRSVDCVFAAVKFVYGQCPGLRGTVASPEVIQQYRSLMSDHNLHVPIRQPRFLTGQSLDVLGCCAIMPINRGTPCTMILMSTGAFLVHADGTTHELDRVAVPSRLHNTVVVGNWWENRFEGRDVLIASNRDVTGLVFSERTDLLKTLCRHFPLCGLVPCYTTDLDFHVLRLIKTDGGVTIVDKQSCRVYVFQPVECIGINFHVAKHGRSTFVLRPGLKASPFAGTETYPYISFIPIAFTDREFMGPLTGDSVFEFRWESDGFMPYTRVSPDHLSTPEYANAAWGAINEDLPVKTVVDKLTTFKREVFHSKDIMIQQKQKHTRLKMLPVNKSVVFNSPLEGDDVLVRTGTIGEGSCLLHALLHAYTKDYIDLDARGRMAFVRRFRASLASGVDQDSWGAMGGGLIARVPFQENVHTILQKFYEYIDTGELPRSRTVRTVIKKVIGGDLDKLEVIKLIKELIPLDSGFEQRILPMAENSAQDESLGSAKDETIRQTAEYLDDQEELQDAGEDKVVYIVEVALELVNEVLNIAEDAAFKSYLKSLSNVNEDMDGYQLELISDRFKRDIYFIDGKTRMPYLTGATAQTLQGRKSYIVVWVGGCHYEIVGRLLPGNRIQREFGADDIIIQKLRAFAVAPETVKMDFPELTPYLPREYRYSESQSPRRCSDSEVESRCSSGSDYYRSSDEDSD